MPQMTIMLNSIVTHRRVAEILRSSMQGKVWLPYDEGYDEARAMWNGAVDHQPAIRAPSFSAIPLPTEREQATNSHGVG
jgi:hypothetical protein